MKNLKYYVAINDPAAGATILGSGWSEQAARADAAGNGADNIHTVLGVPAELAERIEREGDSPALAALCYAQGGNSTTTANAATAGSEIRRSATWAIEHEFLPRALH